MLAASYLPRRWPSKYCHRYESLRPCSGWERVVYSHLATSEFFEYAQNYIRYNIINLTFSVWVKGSCGIKDSYVAIVVLRHLLAFASANATRDCAPPYGLEKALVRLVMLG